MLKILMLSPWLPWPPFDGARIRILETLKFLSARHKVTLLAHIHSEDELHNVDSIRNICEAVHVELVASQFAARFRRMGKAMVRGAACIEGIHFSEELAQSVSTLTDKDDFDILQIEFSFLARYLSAIGRRSRVKTVLSSHNIESQRFAKEAQLSSWSARRLVLLRDSIFSPAWEKKAVRQFDGIAAVSVHDETWMRRHNPPAQVTLIPNGVDIEYFHPQDKHPKEQLSVVFTGSMDYPPNVDAVIWFAQEIFPKLRSEIPNLQFNIVGTRPTIDVKALASRQDIHVTGEVPDVRPFISEALAFVVPLRSGGGTRLKILQAMAMECPVVSTHLGAEGLEVVPGENILFADTPDQFLQHVTHLKKSPESARAIAASGRRLCSSRYDWRSCLLGFEDLYTSVLTRTSL